MSIVYRAEPKDGGPVVALKVLARTLSGEDKHVQRFVQEAKALSRLRHPGIVRVLDYGHAADGQLFMTMDLLAGRTLGQLIKDEAPIAPDRAVAIIRGVCEALAHAHQLGIIHRDLKPDNVFLCPEPNGGEATRILDFGIAKVLDDGPALETLTQTGVICGTPLYLPPEQALGKPLDGRADLYSVGVILYELLSGRPPFIADTPIAVVMKHIHDAPPKFSALGVPATALIPVALEALTLRLLDKTREKRPRTAHECAELLRGALASAPVVTPAAPAPVAPPKVAPRPTQTAAYLPGIRAGLVASAGPAPAVAPKVAPIAPPAPSPMPVNAPVPAAASAPARSATQLGLAPRAAIAVAAAKATSTADRPRSAPSPAPKASPQPSTPPVAAVPAPSPQPTPAPVASPQPIAPVAVPVAVPVVPAASPVPVPVPVLVSKRVPDDRTVVDLEFADLVEVKAKAAIAPARSLTVRAIPRLDLEGIEVRDMGSETRVLDLTNLPIAAEAPPPRQTARLVASVVAGAVVVAAVVWAVAFRDLAAEPATEAPEAAPAVSQPAPSQPAPSQPARVVAPAAPQRVVKAARVELSDADVRPRRNLEIAAVLGPQRPAAPATAEAPVRSPMMVDSQPTAANVTRGGRVVGKTPYPVELTPGAPPTELLITADGYEPLTWTTSGVTAPPAGQERIVLVLKRKAPTRPVVGTPPVVRPKSKVVWEE